MSEKKSKKKDKNKKKMKKARRYVTFFRKNLIDIHALADRNSRNIVFGGPFAAIRDALSAIIECIDPEMKEDPIWAELDLLRKENNRKAAEALRLEERVEEYRSDLQALRQQRTEYLQQIQNLQKANANLNVSLLTEQQGRKMDAALDVSGIKLLRDTKSYLERTYVRKAAKYSPGSTAAKNKAARDHLLQEVTGYLEEKK